MKVAYNMKINIDNKNNIWSVFLKFVYRLLKLQSRANFLLKVGIILLIFWILVAIFANIIAPYDPISQNLEQRFERPSRVYWFGTDEFGRDILSRTIIGSRLSILAGFLTVFIASIIGILFGGISGFAGGIVDDIMMRISEIFSSFPAIILAMTITAALGPSLFNTLLALVIVVWPRYARLMRSLTISVKENEYVEASKALGASKIRILLKEILPNSAGTMIIMSSLDMGRIILVFSGLSFLGLGSPPPAPEWGMMVAQGMQNFNYWWIYTFPGLSILSIAMAANIVGDGIRDYLDPKIRKNF